MDRKATDATARDLMFVSYSHADTAWLKRLKVHLKPLIRQGTIEIWDDQQIQAGARWRDEIQAALDRTRVAVLLVSPDFLASDFIAEHELPRLLNADRKLTVFWIPVSPSNFRIFGIGNYQAVIDPKRTLAEMTRAEADRALATIANKIELAFRGLVSSDSEHVPHDRRQPRRGAEPVTMSDDAPEPVTVPDDAPEPVTVPDDAPEPLGETAPSGLKIVK